jgi:hypothetical protein
MWQPLVLFVFPAAGLQLVLQKRDSPQQGTGGCLVVLFANSFYATVTRTVWWYRRPPGSA